MTSAEYLRICIEKLEAQLRKLPENEWIRRCGYECCLNELREQLQALEQHPQP